MVEDDVNFGVVLKSYLELSDFEVDLVNDGAKAVAAFKKGDYQICILDVMLPNVDGFSIAKEIKRLDKDIPLVFLTAKTLKEDILKGFKLGADDYITKPFDAEVLLYKIRAILSRQAGRQAGRQEGDDRTVFPIGHFTFDSAKRTVSLDDFEAKLSPKEAQLLRMLCVNMNGITPRDEALRAIWGDDNYFTTRSMDVFVSKLRKHLRADPRVKIENIHGSGFVLRVDQLRPGEEEAGQGPSK